MINHFDNMILYEEYQKELEMLDDDKKFNAFMNDLHYLIEDKEYEKDYEEDYKNKRIVLYEKNNYMDMYVIYVMFCAVIYQLIIGEDKMNAYFGGSS